MTELEALLALTVLPGLGPVKIQQLYIAFGSASHALQAGEEEVKRLPGFSRLASNWQVKTHSPEWQHEMERVTKACVTLIPFYSPLYPKRLKEIEGHPSLLYVQGVLKPEDFQSIAIVGTRGASIYGNEMAGIIAKELAAAGITVVSGLARGIDTQAHLGALRGGRTIAVIGSGLSNIYPNENKQLAKHIAQNGAIISEFPMTTPPDRHNFPRRNRIVSGMTLGTLLIEAPIKSGAMITMNLADRQNRKLYVLPGRADSATFCGNHLLLKQGKAKLVENAQDILLDFQDLVTPKMHPIPPLIQYSLNVKEASLLQLMPNEELNIDQLSHAANLPVFEVQHLLMSLVLKKVIKEFPGKLYKKRV